MTWNTHWLRATAEAAMLSALDAAGLIGEDEDGNSIPLQASHTHALDVIGALPGKAGYHANLRVGGTAHPALADVTIAQPATPQRRWF